MQRCRDLVLRMCLAGQIQPRVAVQVKLIGVVGGRGPEVRRVGDQTVAQISLGIRPKSGNTSELSWVVCDFWNHEVSSTPLHGPALQCLVQS